MESYEIFYGISGVLGFIGQALLLIFSIVYVIKSKSIDGILMLIGSLLLIITMISRPIISALFMIERSASDMVFIQGILSIISTLFGIIFAIGFAMAMLKLKNIEKP